MERGWGQAGNGHAVRPPQSKEKQGQAGRALLSWWNLVIPAQPIAFLHRSQ